MSGAVVLSTAPTAEEAAALARSLVEEGLAACVNLVPGARSIYRWEGKLCDDAEHLLVIKTSASRRDELLARLPQLHSYDCPEAIALPIEAGAPAYLRWLEEQTAESTS